LVALTLSLVVITGNTFAATNTQLSLDEPSIVIEKMVIAIDNQDYEQYINCFTKENRTEMEKYLNQGKDNFREKSAKLLNIKELPKDVGDVAIGITESEKQLNETRVFYTEIKFDVDKQGKWLYNGVNHRSILLCKKDDNWKIVRISVPSIKYIVSTGNGFNTKEEKSAVNIEETLTKKGLVIDYQGNVIKNLAASKADLDKEKGLKLKPSTSTSGATTVVSPSSSVSASGELSYPTYIKVYFTKQINRDYWGSNSKSIIFYYYCIDCLPLEWIPSWYTTAPHSVRSGALCVKMYGWYHVYHPKWQFSPYYSDVKDNTDDQEYQVNSRHQYTTDAMGDVAGIGFNKPDGTLFENWYRQGTYDSSWQHSNYLSAYGSKYWADQGKDFYWICHYYYDYSASGVGSQNQLHFFSY